MVWRHSIKLKYIFQWESGMNATAIQILIFINALPHRQNKLSHNRPNGWQRWTNQIKWPKSKFVVRTHSNSKCSKIDGILAPECQRIQLWNSWVFVSVEKSNEINECASNCVSTFEHEHSAATQLVKFILWFFIRVETSCGYSPYLPRYFTRLMTQNIIAYFSAEPYFNVEIYCTVQLCTHDMHVLRKPVLHFFFPFYFIFVVVFLSLSRQKCRCKRTDADQKHIVCYHLWVGAGEYGRARANDRCRRICVRCAWRPHGLIRSEICEKRMNKEKNRTRT